MGEERTGTNEERVGVGVGTNLESDLSKWQASEEGVPERLDYGSAEREVHLNFEPTAVTTVPPLSSLSGATTR